MHSLLWVLQVLFGLYFLFTGVTHFIVPDGLPEMMNWMYDLSDGLHATAGAAEILGGLGLILPGITKVMPQLTVYAAIGLAVVMVSAVIWHLGREGETVSVVQDIVLAAVLAFIAYGRLRLAPLEARSA